MRPSSVTNLPALEQGSLRAKQPSQKRGLQPLAHSGTAPSLSTLSNRASELGLGVDQTVEMLSQRPGTGPMLHQIQDAQHRAAVLDATAVFRNRAPPPRLLNVPGIKQGALARIARRSNVLSDIADSMRADELTTPGSATRLWLSPYAEPSPYPVGATMLRSRSNSSMTSGGAFGARVATAEAASRRAGRPPGITLSSSSSTLHASKTAAQRSAALLETRVDAYLSQCGPLRSRTPP